ncbi:NAD(P)H-dependent oxidoreductase [Hoeflea sp. CAU 1731]
MALVQIVVGSVREKRIGRKVADWFMETGAGRDDFELELVDLKEVNLPLFDEPNHPRFANYVHDHTKAWSETVARADGFVFVTPEYNHSFPPALKNAIDYLSQEWKFKPAGFVSYGGVAAGTRAVQALKPVLACFQMPLVLENVHIPFVGSLFNQDGAFVPPDGLDDAARLLHDRMAFWIEQQAGLRES